VRPRLAAIATRHGGRLKVVEVPPGPPVLAPLVAEVYGPDHAGQVRVAHALRDRFEATDGVVDVDDSVEAPAHEWRLQVDRAKAARDLGYLHEPTARYAVPVRAELPVADQADLARVLDLRVRGAGADRRAGGRPTGDPGAVDPAQGSVTGGLRDRRCRGRHRQPAVRHVRPVRGARRQRGFGPAPRAAANPYDYAIKWDGEWQVTYDTFRDMGIAYSVGLVLIYLLVVAQFRAYLVPLIIMAPIPLTIIGVLPGHALLGAQFTATSMIGMIVLAGIIVRNSILLVDFINQEHASGVPFAEAVIRSGAVRAKPIILTGLAAMLGGFFILDDPIFNGLAIALLFGVAVSTLLTLVVIPVMLLAAAGSGPYNDCAPTGALTIERAPEPAPRGMKNGRSPTPGVPHRRQAAQLHQGG
jgi:hypothetical protein